MVAEFKSLPKREDASILFDVMFSDFLDRLSWCISNSHSSFSFSRCVRQDGVFAIISRAQTAHQSGPAISLQKKHESTPTKSSFAGEYHAFFPVDTAVNEPGDVAPARCQAACQVGCSAGLQRWSAPLVCLGCKSGVKVLTKEFLCLDRRWQTINYIWRNSLAVR